MSRSRKKHSVVSDYSRSSTKKEKRFAAKAVRNYKELTDYGFMPAEISDGCIYKKLYCSWNIFDYKWHWFPSDLREFPDTFDQEDLDKAYRK